MKKIFQKLTIGLAVSLIFFGETSLAQPGCTDPQANNYDPQATENDGSCMYPTTSYTPSQIAVLPGNLTECSGLAYFGNRLWTHLDGGNLSQLFEIDTLSGAVKEIVTIPNSNNTDWEDLAEDDEHIYIGNFGNNFGSRTDLGIYKIKKSNLVGGNPLPELIEFSYSDQTDFTPAVNNNNYDCEAFFFWNDSLHLFSKNWVDFKTRHYVLPATPGTHIAQLRDSLNVVGQITAADISDDGLVVLLGYNKSTIEAFMWLLFDFPESRFFSGNKRRISLGSVIATSQVEGIVFRNETRGYICAEERVINQAIVLPPKLMAFEVAQWLQNPVATTDRFADWGISIYPNPAGEYLFISANKWPPSPFKLRVTDVAGKTLLERLYEQPTTAELKIDVSNIPAGTYLLILENEKEKSASLFYKK